jgi:hypothetical protein
MLDEFSMREIHLKSDTKLYQVALHTACSHDISLLGHERNLFCGLAFEKSSQICYVTKGISRGLIDKYWIASNNTDYYYLAIEDRISTSSLLGGCSEDLRGT